MSRPALNNGIAILNAEFWREVRKIQREGISVAFLQFSESFEVAGIYSADMKMIGLDIFANPGTLKHEFRHHLQYMRLPHPRYMTALSRSCSEQTIRFLGELDATTIQLSSWANVFDGVEIESLLEMEGSPVRSYPQTRTLHANLYYPALAFGWLDDADCPAELTEPLKTIVTHTSEASLKISEGAHSLLAMHGTLPQIVTEMKTECSHAPSETNFNCKMLEKRVHEKVERATQLKHSINKWLEEEALARPNYIREELSKIPSPMSRALYEMSGAYRFLTETEGKVL